MNGLISLENISVYPIEKELTELNEFSSKYGLVLSPDDVHSLSQMRNRSVRENERVEIGSGAVPEIVKRFCTSRYVTPENYAYILEEVTYLFYYIKTETDDRISDGELISELFSRFELECRGEIDTLENREAERIIRKVNSGENYKKWFTERDELEPAPGTGSREAPENQVRETYGDWFFNGDAPADHDKYEKEVAEDEMKEDDDDFDLDAFDEFFDKNAALMREEPKKDVAQEDVDDDDFGDGNTEDDNG